MASTKTRHWSADVHDVLCAAEVRQVAYVPDNGLARLIDLCRADKKMRSVVLTTEEEGIAQMAGAWLGGQRGVFLTQSGGVGNCINMLSMMQECRIPLLALVSMRGQWGEGNPWQVPMGQAVRPVLEAMGVKCFAVDDAARVGETFGAAADLAFSGDFAAAVLVSQRVIGVKGFRK